MGSKGSSSSAPSGGIDTSQFKTMYDLSMSQGGVGQGAAPSQAASRPESYGDGGPGGTVDRGTSHEPSRSKAAQVAEMAAGLSGIVGFGKAALAGLVAGPLAGAKVGFESYKDFESLNTTAMDIKSLDRALGKSLLDDDDEDGDGGGGLGGVDAAGASDSGGIGGY